MATYVVNINSSWTGSGHSGADLDNAFTYTEWKSHLQLSGAGQSGDTYRIYGNKVLTSHELLTDWDTYSYKTDITFEGYDDFWSIDVDVYSFALANSSNYSRSHYVRIKDLITNEQVLFFPGTNFINCYFTEDVEFIFGIGSDSILWSWPLNYDISPQLMSCTFKGSVGLPNYKQDELGGGGYVTCCDCYFNDIVYAVGVDIYETDFLGLNLLNCKFTLSENDTFYSIAYPGLGYLQSDTDSLCEFSVALSDNLPTFDEVSETTLNFATLGITETTDTDAIDRWTTYSCNQDPLGNDRTGVGSFYFSLIIPDPDPEPEPLSIPSYTIISPIHKVLYKTNLKG